MNSFKTNPNLVNHMFSVLRVAFALTFIFSGLLKLIDLEQFYTALKGFDLFSDDVNSIVKYVIPLLEITLGTILVFNFKSHLFSQLITTLVIAFTAFLITKLAEGKELSCACFGELTTSQIDIYTVIRNLILIIWGIMLTVYYQIKQKDIKENQKRRIYEIIRFNFFVAFFFFLSIQNLLFAYQNRELKVTLAKFNTEPDLLK